MLGHGNKNSAKGEGSGDVYLLPDEISSQLRFHRALSRGEELIRPNEF